MFLAPVLSRTSLSATIAVHAGIPVAPVIRSQSRTSRSKPSQPDDVPFQPITLTFACASSSAAARISVSSNCASAGPDSAISVTLKREKCAVTSGRPASIAVVTGSRIVLEDGVSIPRNTRDIQSSLSATFGGNCPNNQQSRSRATPEVTRSAGTALASPSGSSLHASLPSSLQASDRMTTPAAGKALIIDAVTHRYGTAYAVDHVTLDIK